MNAAQRIAAAIAAILAATCLYQFYTGYYLRRDCFNAEGRCFDAAEGVVYLEQAAIGWGIATLLCTLSAVILIVWRRR